MRKMTAVLTYLCLCKYQPYHRVGNFNQSHASLTSPEALTALQKLATSNPSLCKELTASTHNTADEDIEPDYFAELEDSGVVNKSDTPVDVAIKHIIDESASSPRGFLLHEDGSLARSGRVEDPDDVDNAHASADEEDEDFRAVWT
jgi:hypothetical protein